MDYEKAYKAVLKTATQWIKDGCTDKERICLESVFPKLRESEDEKIRKALIDEIKVWDEDYKLFKHVSKEKALAYLEKQKEQDKCQEYCVRSHCIGCPIYEKQKEQKPAEWSEEDEVNLGDIKCALYNYYGEERAEELYNMLKSRRPDSYKNCNSRWKPGEVCYGTKGDPDPAGVWKPSEEQMEALNYAYSELFKREDVGHNILGPLQNLIDTLRKL